MHKVERSFCSCTKGIFCLVSYTMYKLCKSKKRCKSFDVEGVTKRVSVLLGQCDKNWGVKKGAVKKIGQVPKREPFGVQDQMDLSRARRITHAFTCSLSLLILYSCALTCTYFFCFSHSLPLCPFSHNSSWPFCSVSAETPHFRYNLNFCVVIETFHAPHSVCHAPADWPGASGCRRRRASRGRWPDRAPAPGGSPPGRARGSWRPPRCSAPACTRTALCSAADSTPGLNLQHIVAPFKSRMYFTVRNAVFEFSSSCKIEIQLWCFVRIPQGHFQFRGHHCNPVMWKPHIFYAGAVFGTNFYIFCTWDLKRDKVLFFDLKAKTKRPKEFEVPSVLFFTTKEKVVFVQCQMCSWILFHRWIHCVSETHLWNWSRELWILPKAHFMGQC